jgi:hypothetical protein
MGSLILMCGKCTYVQAWRVQRLLPGVRGKEKAARGGGFEKVTQGPNDHSCGGDDLM